MKWEILDKVQCFKGFYELVRYRVRHALFAGGMGKPITRELMVRGRAAAVLPYDPITDQVMLVEQFRIGAIDSPHGPWLVEIIAGLVEAGEQAEAVVRREALEEAGCALQEILPICEYYSSPGGSTERVSLFAARMESRGQGGIFGLADEGEDIRAFLVPADEAIDQMQRGLIDNAMSIIALQWLMLNREQLRANWR
ncbi:ADP-ribose diphosphatase [Acidihalobacter yilgarnensis]|uniref:ADP-ribose pyrophosphatase n=1 Tax=Acidihalobacter yilgarnensis TaxID=2819280 RepID=A0A1D8INM0_9GAMM|nr:NUDIX domain-containing protein [Acidihalobacter yilgarnensis]AOU98062.1 ADP-ribose diphosphatase [Acidihalobacter yilgarnensis]